MKSKPMDMRYIFCLCASLFFLGLSAHSQSYQPVTDFKTIKQLVDSNRVKMVFTIATTHHTFFIQPDTPYADQNIRIGQDSAFIQIRDSLAIGYLPYFGTGYSIPQTGGRGIVFNNKMLDVVKSVRGKGRRPSVFYQFSVVGKNDTYKINLDIRYNGLCYLFINSLHRSPISYTGQIVKDLN